MARAITTLKCSLFFVFLTSPQSVAFANNSSTETGVDLFFILSKDSAPVTVTSSLPEKNATTYMRLPDRSSNRSSAQPNEQGASNKSQVKTAAELQDGGHSYGDDKAQRQLLKFKSTNIKGTVKLPTVKFSDFRPVVELREPMPALDFTSKTLKDGGF